MQPYQTRVICLRSSLDRRKHICSEFEKFNIDFSFLDALEAKETIFYDNFLSLKFNPKALTSGEVACFMSHVLIWHALASSDLEEMVIYEDDIWLGKGSKELFSG